MSVIDRSQDARESVGPIGKRRRLVVWTSRRGTHLGSGHVRPRQQTGHMIASDRIHTNKLLQPGGRPHMGPCFRRDDDEDYSAACNTVAAFVGAIQNAFGRSNRKFAPTASAAFQIRSAPTTPTMVTINEIVPMSGTMPVLSSSVRVAAIGRKKAR